MEDILKSEIPATAKDFWYEVGVRIQKRVKGVVQVLYNKFTNSIIIRIFFEKFNYSICTDFRANSKEDATFIINNVLNAVRFNIYEEIFK